MLFGIFILIKLYEHKHYRRLKTSKVNYMDSNKISATGMSAIFLVVVTILITQFLDEAAFTGTLALITGFVAVLLWLKWLIDIFGH